MVQPIRASELLFQQFADVEKDEGRSTSMRHTVKWIRNFVCRTNRRQNVVENRVDSTGPVDQQLYELNHPRAHVCPFVLESIDRRLFWVAESELNDFSIPAIERLLRELIDRFLAEPPPFNPREAGRPVPADSPELFKIYMVAFPHFMHVKGPTPVLDGIHDRLKPDFVRAGLMLGQFYSGCPQEGVYSADFRPLVSPWPTFAIRYLIDHDWKFNGKEVVRPLHLAYFPDAPFQS